MHCTYVALYGTHIAYLRDSLSALHRELVFHPDLQPLTMSTPTDEPAAPVRIGSGSFGSTYVVRGGPLAFKIAHFRKQHETLKQEYEALRYLFVVCNADSFFGVPKPLAFHDSEHKVLLANLFSTVLQLRSPRIMQRGAKKGLQR
jgi:hypothetical protein